MPDPHQSSPADGTIVRAAIYPPIGIARVGNSAAGYYLGPEVTEDACEGA